MTLPRRFAIGVIRAHGRPVAETLRRPARKPRLALDFLKLVFDSGK